MTFRAGYFSFIFIIAAGAKKFFVFLKKGVSWLTWHVCMLSPPYLLCYPRYFEDVAANSL